MSSVEGRLTLGCQMANNKNIFIRLYRILAKSTGLGVRQHESNS